MPRTARNVRVPDALWPAAKARAAREYTTVSAVVVRLLAAWLANADVAAVAVPRGRTTSRNIRVPDELWDAAKAKAEQEHTTVSAVVVRLLAGWVAS